MSGEKDQMTTSPPEKLQGFEWWRRSLQYRTGLGLSAQEAKQFEHDWLATKKPLLNNAAEEYRDWVLRYSPTVRFMMDHIRKLGFDISSKHIVCEPCGDNLKSGGFHESEGILLCSDQIRDKWHLEDTLAHELVHMYDYIKFDVNLKNLKHHACTEIRASMLSGECRVMNEIQKTGLSNFGEKFQLCIKRRAVLSVSANPYCANKEEAEKAVNSVWQSCFNDTRPFERVYR